MYVVDDAFLPVTVMRIVCVPADANVTVPRVISVKVGLAEY